MANKYINTFNTTSDFKAYTASDEMAVPNIAYLLDTDEVKYLSVIPRAVKVGSIVYDDKTFTWPEEPLAEGKTPIGVVYISQDDTPFNDDKSRVIAPKAIGNGKMSITGQRGDGSLANENDGIVCSNYYLNKFGDDSEALTKASNYTIGGIVGWYIPSLFESKLLPYNVSDSEANTGTQTVASTSEDHATSSEQHSDVTSTNKVDVISESGTIANEHADSEDSNDYSVTYDMILRMEPLMRKIWDLFDSLFMQLL